MQESELDYRRKGKGGGKLRRGERLITHDGEGKRQDLGVKRVKRREKGKHAGRGERRTGEGGGRGERCESKQFGCLKDLI